MATLFSDEDCKQILKNYLQNLDKNVKYVSSELKPLSENMEGFVGEHNKLIINYEAKGVKKYQEFFVKTEPTKSVLQKDMAEGLGVFKKEIFAYEILFQEFKKYGYYTSFAANFYYSVPNKTLVLEDVTSRGFSKFEKKVLTEDHLKCALKSLALFHAAGYALERTETKELNRKFILGEEYSEYFLENFFVQYSNGDVFAKRWWKTLSKTSDVIIDLLPESDAYKQEFRKLMQESEAGKAFVGNPKSKINRTCGHGDLWSNNLLFKYENNVPVGCCLVDYQFIRYCYPSLDVLLVIFTNTSVEFRKRHLENLFLYYHKTLADILKEYGYDVEEIHPLEDFYDSIKFVEVEATQQNFLATAVSYLPKIDLSDFGVSDEGFSELMFSNEKLAEEAFKTDIRYRNAISDAVYTMRDALVKRRQK